jgi:hypothetical protein
MSDPKQVNLDFINRDVRTQLDRSRDMIDVAQILNGVLPNVDNQDAKSKIEESIRRLLSISNALTNNANATSSNAALTIVSSTGHKP